MELASPFDIKHAFVTPISDVDAEFHKDVAAAKTAVKTTAKAAIKTTVKATVDTALLTLEHVPDWYGENPFILSGYRPVFASVSPCFSSWWYCHNQSANIFTHLIPGLLALALNAGFGGWFAERYPEASLADQAVFHVYLTMCALCFGVSATYHTMLCHSRDLADLWIRLDYASITLLILGSVVPQLYVCFYCEPTLLRGYLSMFCTVAALNVYSCINDRNGSKNWIMNRLVPSIAMSLGAVIPNLHAATIFPYEQLVKQSGLNYYYLEGVFMFAGVVLLATRFPECYFPGKFDYLGASHTLMHCLVVMGTVCHFVGILSGFDWNYNNQRRGQQREHFYEALMNAHDRVERAERSQAKAAPKRRKGKLSKPKLEAMGGVRLYDFNNDATLPKAANEKKRRGAMLRQNKKGPYIYCYKRR